MSGLCSLIIDTELLLRRASRERFATEIDVQGAVAVRERQPDAVVVLVVPPDRREQERRMRSRGDSENHIQQRLDAAEAEEQTGGSLADAVVLNEDLQTAVAEIESIIYAARA